MLMPLLAAVMAAGLSGSSTETPATDEPALERAARTYRVQVYDTFHADREEFDRRRAAWDQMKDAWEAAGRQARDVPELIRWLETATNRSLPDLIEPVPELPAIATGLRKAVDSKPSVSTRETNGEELSQTAPAKPATPVSSKATFDRPRADESKPAGRPIATPPPAAAEPTDSSDATKPAGAASWVHDLGQVFGEDMNDLAITLAWKRESK